MRNIKDTQNFLHSKELVRHLIGICNIKLDDVVIEIGPGKGIITNELAHKARKVVAIEFDEELYEKGGGAVFLDCDPRRRRPWRSTRGNSGNARSSCM